MKLGSLVAPRGENYTFSQFRGYKELTAPAAALLARCPDWRLATRVVTYKRVEWAIDSFTPI